MGRRATAFAARWLLLIVLALPAIWSTGLAAQGAPPAPPNSAKPPPKPTPCELVQQPTTRLTTDSIPGTGLVVYIGGGVLLKCPSRGITLRGDSAQQYPDRDQMIGNAVYDEPRLHITSDYLNYFPVDDRVTAAGNVHARLPSGSTLDGPQAEYLHAAPRIRPHDQVRAGGRPTVTIVEKDSAGRPSPPMTVIANNVFVDNDSLVYGSGDVTISRPNLSATGDSAFIDQGEETMRLMRKPQLKGTKDHPFTLTGTVIDMFSKNRKLQRVLARPNAIAVSDSMTLKSDTIDLRVRDDQLDHAYAWSGADSARVEGRAQVISPSQHLTADSLDVAMPNQRIQLVRAVRRALAQSRPDTVRFRAVKPDTLDWLAGDTIVAHFDSVAAGDTSKNPAIKQLVASGHASSLYHMAASDTSEHRPAINHVVARLITIDFDQRKVATVTTVDSVQGEYLEPQPDSTARKAKADSTKAKADSAKARDRKPTAKPPTSPPSGTPVKPPANPPATPIDLPEPARR